MALETYTVTLDTPHGIGQLDLLATTPEHAGNRARVSAIAAGWGDFDTVSVVDVSVAVFED